MTDKLYAESLCRLTVLQGNKRITGLQLIAEIEHNEVFNPPDEMPHSVREYLKWDAASRASMETSQAQLQDAATVAKAPLTLWEQLKSSMNLPF